MMMPRSPRRPAPSTCRFREYNARHLDALLLFTAGTVQGEHTTRAFMCECTLPECDSSIHLTLEEIRRFVPDDGCRVIAPHHVHARGGSEVVEQEERYWIVRRVRQDDT